jgi:hypothetical protein
MALGSLREFTIDVIRRLRKFHSLDRAKPGWASEI